MKSLPILLAFVALALPAAGEVPCGTPGLTARVEPEVATPGESILVTLSNNTGTTVNLPSTCVFTGIYAAEPYQLFYTPFCLQIITPIAQGQSYSQSWNQQGNSGEQAPDGDYSIFIRSGYGFTDFCFLGVMIAENVPALAQWGMAALIAASALVGLWALRRRHLLAI